MKRQLQHIFKHSLVFGRQFGWILGLVAGTGVVMVLAQVVMGHAGANPFVRWVMWDAPHYLDLATHGYVRNGEAGYYIVFFPLFPALVWLAHWLVWGDYLVTGLLLPNIFTVVAAVWLYKLVCLDEPATTARRAVWFMMLFPTAMFLHLPYTESLFLMLAVGTIYLARRGRYEWAILLAGLAAITRMQGLAVTLALLAELWLQEGRHIRRPRLWLAAVVVPGLAFGYYLLLNQIIFDSPWHFLVAEQQRWGLSPTPIWHGALNAWRVAQWWSWGVNSILLGWAQLVAAAVGIVGVVYSFWRLRLSYAMYALGILGLSTAMSHWTSEPRYMLVMFPLFIMMARWGRRPWVYWSLLGVNAALAAF